MIKKSANLEKEGTSLCKVEKWMWEFVRYHFVFISASGNGWEKKKLCNLWCGKVLLWKREYVLSGKVSLWKIKGSMGSVIMEEW